MTQEHKELLLIDICARLPYKVKISIPELFTNKKQVETLNEIFKGKDNLYRVNDSGILIEYIKPYLFPLSSMTDKQEKEIQEIVGDSDIACIIRKAGGLELWLDSTDTDPTIWLDTIFEVQDYLNKNHFDYRNLINKNLAIDCTNLNIY